MFEFEVVLFGCGITLRILNKYTYGKHGDMFMFVIGRKYGDVALGVAITPSGKYGLGGEPSKIDFNLWLFNKWKTLFSSTILASILYKKVL